MAAVKEAAEKVAALGDIGGGGAQSAESPAKASCAQGLNQSPRTSR